jgi:N-acetylglutamate synthase
LTGGCCVTPAVARRRSNSALPPPAAVEATTAQRARVLDLAEQFYARHNQATVVQVSPAELHDELDGELDARGYRRQAPTAVLTAPISRVLHLPSTTSWAMGVTETATPRWQTAWAEAEGRTDAAATGKLVLARIGPRTGYVTATQDADVLAVGMLVVERGWAGVFCMATRPQARRRGMATAVLRHGAGWAADYGAQQLYLQVEETNRAAVQLYTRLGFELSHHYHYRVAPPQTGSESAAPQRSEEARTSQSPL